MEIKRDHYLNQLISKRHNSLIKIITGLSRTGKSYLLFHMFKQYLLEEGVDSSHIIEIALDDQKNKDKRDPDECIDYVYDLMNDHDMYYLFIDEIGFMQEYEEAFDTFLHMDYLDVYVIGNSSEFLSIDFTLDFRKVVDVIQMYPLTFCEFYQFHDDLTWEDAYHAYRLYGGLPYVSLLEKDEDKKLYLKQMFPQTYWKDFLERNKIKNDQQLKLLIDVVALSVGTLINARKIYNTNPATANIKISEPTIKQYLHHLEDTFALEKAMRYDLKEEKYFSTPYKYYFSDLGLRNARLNFHDIEEPHMMENIIFNELRFRGYSVDIGVCELLEKKNQSYTREKIVVNFVVNNDDTRYYIQVADAFNSEAKKAQIERSLIHIDDDFKKIIIVKEYDSITRDNNGITIMSLKDFLLNQNSLDM